VTHDATALIDRRDWITLADRLLASARPYASPGHARITLPGPEGGYGRAVDGLEGFARTFLLAGFRIAGERGEGLDELADWYATGIATGTDPNSPERWVRLPEHGQAKVEAASLALILDMTRPWIWDRLAPSVQERVVEYLSPAVGDDTYPRTNWLWFRLVVQTFLRSVGGPFSLDDMQADLAQHDSYDREDGWMSDGAERSYDHYVGWAMHLYPTLWARMAGAEDLAAPRRERYVATLDRFLSDAIMLVGADGAPLIQGRSLIYRFAAAAPFWVGAVAGVPSLSLGALRGAANAVVSHFVEHGAPDERGLLTLGWHAPWPKLAQSYSGPGSPYWASKGMLGLALPADHPVWTATPEPLPVQSDDTLRAIVAPGWIVSGTHADGIVRVINHGTDHAVEGSNSADSPLYARLGYSTATFPVVDEPGWVDPVDQSVALVDAAGRASHRSGMRTLTVCVDEGVGVAGSVTSAHWVDPDPVQVVHGSGRTGVTTPAGQITVFSLVRGPWELRLSRVDEAVAEAVHLRVAGWAGVSGLASRVHAVIGTGRTNVTTCPDAGPLGPATVPWVEYPVRVSEWVATLIELTTATTKEIRCHASIAPAAGEGLDVRVEWPDGLRSHTHLNPPTPGIAALADR
jgi:hypothetical protein